MAFHHSMTFLRSALARDPFCHGDLISAEDVIRLEAKFPTLFDKPPSSTDSASEKAPEFDDTFLTTSPLKAKPSMSTEKVLPNKHASSSPSSGLKARPRVVPGPAKRKPIICKYHQKCFTGGGDASESEVYRKPNEKLKASCPTTGKVQGSLRMLNKPSISLEDLREVLKQVLEEEQRPKNSRRVGARSLPSPYTEDLVKKFFGKKMEEMKRQKLKSQAINKRKEERQELANAKPKAKPISQAFSTKKITSRREHPPADKLEPNKGQRVGSSTSAPGFIRVRDELPRAPPPKLGVTYQHKRTDSGLNISGNSSPRVDHTDAPVRQSTSASVMDSSSKHQVVAEKCSYPQETTEESSSEFDFPSPRPKTAEMVKPTIVRDTRVIHLTCPKRLVKSETSLSRHELRYPLPKSSYNQLLAAHQATTNLETKAMLRKQERFDRKIVTEQFEKMKHSYHGNRSEDEDSPLQIVNRYRYQVERKTSDTLEKIAGELVYTQILHQLSELKLEQETRQKIIGGPSYRKSQSNRSQVAPSDSEHTEKLVKISPNSTPAAITETENESQKESEAVASVTVIKTPVQEPTSSKVERTPDPDTGKDANSEKVLPRFVPGVPPAEREDDSGDETGASISDAVLKTPVPTPRTTNDRQLASTSGSEQETWQKIISGPLYSKSQPSRSQVAPPDSEHTEKLLKISPNSTPAAIAENENESQKESEAVASVTVIKTPVQEPTSSKVERTPDPDTGKDANSEKVLPRFVPRVTAAVREADSGDETGASISDAVLKTPVSTPRMTNDPQLASTSGSEQEKNREEILSSIVPTTVDTIEEEEEEEEEEVEEEEEEEDSIVGRESRETVVDLLSEGEFVGEVGKSPGELSLRHHLKAPAEKLVFPKDLLSEEIASLKSLTRTTDYDEESNGEVGEIEDEKLEEYEISHISEGVQLAADKSWGKSVGER